MGNESSYHSDEERSLSASYSSSDGNGMTKKKPAKPRLNKGVQSNKLPDTKNKLSHRAKTLPKNYVFSDDDFPLTSDDDDDDVDNYIRTINHKSKYPALNIADLSEQSDPNDAFFVSRSSRANANADRKSMTPTVASRSKKNSTASPQVFTPQTASTSPTASGMEPLMIAPSIHQTQSNQPRSRRRSPASKRDTNTTGGSSKNKNTTAPTAAKATVSISGKNLKSNHGNIKRSSAPQNNFKNKTKNSNRNKNTTTNSNANANANTKTNNKNENKDTTTTPPASIRSKTLRDDPRAKTSKNNNKKSKHKSSQSGSVHFAIGAVGDRDSDSDEENDIQKALRQKQRQELTDMIDDALDDSFMSFGHRNHNSTSKKNHKKNIFSMPKIFLKPSDTTQTGGGLSDMDSKENSDEDGDADSESDMADLDDLLDNALSTLDQERYPFVPPQNFIESIHSKFKLVKMLGNGRSCRVVHCRLKTKEDFEEEERKQNEKKKRKTANLMSLLDTGAGDKNGKNKHKKRLSANFKDLLSSLRDNNKDDKDKEKDKDKDKDKDKEKEKEKEKDKDKEKLKGKDEDAKDSNDNKDNISKNSRDKPQLPKSQTPTPSITSLKKGDNNEFNFRPPLGKGDKGSKSLNSVHGTEFALKQLPKRVKKNAQCFKNEVTLLKTLNPHKHIVTYIDSYIDERNFYILLEMCKGGMLLGMFDIMLRLCGKMSGP